ncbi:uncharacterized protein LOC132307247 [Cornus florida]|uniref:uncharacterized protein LOC132307247 n=1 Tax=Cornus florida TaxID=4283 RepID=UPI00289B0D28|nr:uncharacterized protein LOC132307247 [Cornus florida]
MAGRGELGFLKTGGACSLREQLARTTLRNVRSRGHTYVELREDGKRFIFFCTLCMAPCYSDSVLFDHLKGNLHAERYAAAKATLLKPNPWPFNDGVLFFYNSSEQDDNLPISNGNQISLLDTHSDDDNDLAIVAHGEKSSNTGDGRGRHNEFGCISNLYSIGNDAGCDKYLNGNRSNWDLVIPGVMLKDEILDLEVGLMGVGKIAARFLQNEEFSSDITRIWCEWLGKEDFGDEDALTVQEHDFAVVIFTYNYDLGRRGFFDDVKYLLSSSPLAEIDHIEGGRKKRRKSFSDPEDISQSLSNQYESSGEDSQSSNSSNSRSLLDGYDDQLLHSRIVSSKAIRRELRRQQQIAAERMCDLCQHKMLPGKDVAALLNTKTGRLACSSRNVNGAFHLFHISCLIHWILLCEYEILAKPSDGPEVKRRSRRKSGTKFKEVRKENEIGTVRKQIYSVFCPECQGTGINVKGDELEKPTFPLSEIFKYKIKMSDAHRQWMRTPEVLPNCSTGFHFPSSSKETLQEKVLPLKLLRFYHARE